MRLCFDIETDGLIPSLTKIHCIAARDLDDPDNVKSFKPDQIHEGLEYLLQADELCGHNLYGFDLLAIRKLYPDFDTTGIKITDTLVLSRLIRADLKNEDFNAQWPNAKDMPKRLYGSHGLEAWGYRLGIHKGDFGKTTDWSEWSEEMHQYMVQDTFVTYKLWEALAPDKWAQDSIDFEHRIAEICNRIGNAGFTFDNDKAGKLYATLAGERAELADQLAGLFPPWTLEEEFIPKVNNKKLGYVKGVPFIKRKTVVFNPNSRKHIEFCLRQKYKWKPRYFTPSGDAKIDENTLGELPFPEAQKLARSFMLQKRLGQLAEGNAAWMKLVDDDGKLRHSMNSNGTVTGRATHHSPNVAQVPSIRAEYGRDCRELFTVPAGHKLIGADLAGLELRCLAHFMQDGGAYANEVVNGDIHTANMHSFGLSDRNQSKTVAYCMIYGGGDKRLGEAIGKGAKEGRALRERFMQAQPAFAQLTRAVKSTLKSRGHLIGLDGRKLFIRSEHSALNTLLQSAGALICKKWLELIDTEIQERQIPAEILGWIHDEVEVSVKEGYEDDVCNIIQRCAVQTQAEWRLKVPIEAECHIGANWAECH